MSIQSNNLREVVVAGVAAGESNVLILLRLSINKQ